MKILQYVGIFDTTILHQQLIEAFPEWIVRNGIMIVEYLGIDYDPLTSILKLYVPEDADDNLIQQVIDIHDPSAQIFASLSWTDIINTRIQFMSLPNWATWNAQEAEAFVRGDILNGMTKAEIETWVNNNVTNIASAKTALTLIGGELIDLREICSKMALMLVHLRDVAIRRRA